MPNPLAGWSAAHLTMPATDAFAITPSNTVDLTRAARSLYVGGAGDVALITLDGTTITFSGLSAGTVLPVGATRVLATGTTATLILGLI